MINIFHGEVVGPIGERFVTIVDGSGYGVVG